MKLWIRHGNNGRDASGGFYAPDWGTRLRLFETVMVEALVITVTADDNGDGTGDATFDVNAGAARRFYRVEEL